MLRKKTTHSLIIKNEEQNDFKCKWWDVKSSFAQHDASLIEEDARLNSSCNHVFL